MKANHYWPAEIDDYIDSYNQSFDDNIYNDHIHIPITKMVECLVNLMWSNINKIGLPKDIVITDTIGYIASKLHCYNKSKGKSFGYFSVSTKHYLIQWSMRCNKIDNISYSIDAKNPDGETYSDLVEDNTFAESLSNTNSFNAEYIVQMKKWWSKNDHRWGQKKQILIQAMMQVLDNIKANEIPFSNKFDLYRYIAENTNKILLPSIYQVPTIYNTIRLIYNTNIQLYFKWLSGKPLTYNIINNNSLLRNCGSIKETKATKIVKIYECYKCGKFHTNVGHTNKQGQYLCVSCRSKAKKQTKALTSTSNIGIYGRKSGCPNVLTKQCSICNKSKSYSSTYRFIVFQQKEYKCKSCIMKKKECTLPRKYSTKISRKCKICNNEKEFIMNKRTSTKEYTCSKCYRKQWSKKYSGDWRKKIVQNQSL